MGTADETGQSYQNISFSFSPVAKNGEVVDESQPGWQQEHSGKARAVRLPTASGQASGTKLSNRALPGTDLGGRGIGRAPHRRLKGHANYRISVTLMAGTPYECHVLF